MTQQEKYRIWELRQNGLGYKKIAKILNLNEDTVKSHIRRTSKKEPPKPVCEECGKVLIQMPKTKPRRFCSDRCKTQWWSKHPDAGNRSGFSFICEYCGKEFKSYVSKTRRYCSTHCYAQARCKSNEKKRERLIAEKTPCGTEFSNLPTDCQCTVCKWFFDGKRGCPCKKETDKNL
ncbi:MAG: helix-turn-helix transcriptional regulator [Monoglobaceae bacterium]